MGGSNGDSFDDKPGQTESGALGGDLAGLCRTDYVISGHTQPHSAELPIDRAIEKRTCGLLPIVRSLLFAGRMRAFWTQLTWNIQASRPSSKNIILGYIQRTNFDIQSSPR